MQTKLIGEGFAARMNGGLPRPMNMEGQKPNGIQKMPADVVSPLYGVLTIGPQNAPTRFLAVMDSAGTGEPRIWIDANANGDLTDDPPLKWKKIDYSAFDNTPLALYQGSVTVQVRYGKTALPLHLNLLRYDPRDPNREGYRNTLLYIADYARETEMTLGPHTYHALLYDALASGDYRGQRSAANSGIMLMIDVNGNGRFDARGEAYDAWQPFNIRGTTYELDNMAPDGSTFEVVKSKRVVPEILPPPDLRVGRPALPFTKKRLDGKLVHFPADYKGRLVLLYFWASWCPDCQAEIPTVRNAYRQFHEKGVDILGVSVDPSAELIAHAKGIPFEKYVAASHLSWPHIYEGKFWQSDLVQLYFVDVLPAPFLIDGDTGLILAVGNDLKGARLAATLQTALSTRKTK